MRRLTSAATIYWRIKTKNFRPAALWPPGEIDEDGAEDQEQKHDGVYLEGKVVAGVDEAACQRQPDKNNEAPAPVDAAAGEPAQDHNDKGQGNQPAADPAKRNASLQPVVVQLRGPIRVHAL